MTAEPSLVLHSLLPQARTPKATGGPPDDELLDDPPELLLDELELEPPVQPAAVEAAASTLPGHGSAAALANDVPGVSAVGQTFTPIVAVMVEPNR